MSPHKDTQTSTNNHKVSENLVVSSVTRKIENMLWERERGLPEERGGGVTEGKHGIHHKSFLTSDTSVGSWCRRWVGKGDNPDISEYKRRLER